MTEDLQEKTAFKGHSEEYARCLIRCSLDMIISVDNNHRIVEFNKAAEEAFGYNKQEVVGKDIGMLYASTKEVKDVHDLLQGKEFLSTELHNKRKNGETFKSFASVSVIRDAHGNRVGIMGVSRDTTHQKNVENELRIAMEKIEAAGKSKDEFLANMSHEIRTPLNGIIGMTELILDETLSVEQMTSMQTLNREAIFLLNIINNILDFSKIESGKLELEDIPFDLSATFDDIRESFQYKAYQKGLDFNCCLPSDVPCLLIGDPTRLRQILVNLISNALKFTVEGEVIVNVDIVEDIGERARLRFLIKDTGIGIPADKQHLIFEKFVQADSSTSKKYGGTGLGVSLCKQFVELMGGELRLESEEGKGSTFEFTAVFAKQKERESVEINKQDLADKNVLIVHDCQGDRKVLNECLTSFGCVVVEAAGGEEALNILSRAVSSGNSFDLILVNFNMPVMSSVVLVEEIKKIHLLKEIPSIILTNVGEIGDAKVCNDIGVDGYFTKPIRKNYLRKAVESLIASASSTGGEDQADRQLVTRHTITEQKSLKEINILLVEDYPTNQMIAMRYLQHAGYKVDLAEDGLQAVEKYENKHYDLVFMDLQLPEMDGFEAANRIRAHESGLASSGPKETDRAVIIAMTAHATTEIRDRCLNGGMDDFITKPVRRMDVLAMVEKWEDEITASRTPTVPEEVITDSHEAEKAVTQSQKSEETVSSQLRVSDGLAKSDDQTKQADPIDFGKSIEEFEGDEEFFMEVVEGFLESVREQTKSIRQAMSDGNAEMVRTEAHSIKGGAANLTAQNLSDIAAKLEIIGKSGNLQGGVEVMGSLEKEFHRLEDFIKNRQ